jgi:hypothetical protein
VAPEEVNKRIRDMTAEFKTGLHDETGMRRLLENEKTIFAKTAFSCLP